MHFGTTPEGQAVERVMIAAGDLTASILTWGAVLHDVRFVNLPYNLTRGTDDLAAYSADWRYHGGIIGPIANRIGTARVKIGGMMHELERNQDGRIHLHSGKDATHAQIWQIVKQTVDSVCLQLTLPDGMCGLPGHRVITATYTVRAPATLTLQIDAVTDADTLMNFAQHGYWNMDGSDDWSGHRLRIAADHYLPTDADAVPTGEIADVAGTMMDLREGPQISRASHSFDHNFCLGTAQGRLRDVLWFTGKQGVQMVMATTEPGLQVFDGHTAPANFNALAFEAQGWPDAPNHRGFPSIKVRAGETYAQTTTWSFTA